MSTRLVSLVIDAADPAALARFWSAALGWPVTQEDPDEVVVEPPDHDPAQTGQLPLVFVPVDDPKTSKNRVHLDLASTSAEHQAAEVARLRELGAQPADIGQRDVPWVVLADPEGNELCVLDARPTYAGIIPVVAVILDARDPTTLAEFWAAATGWDVVEGEAAGARLRRPDGTGPYLELLRIDDPKTAKLRVHLDVAPYPDDDHTAEVERLRSLGARPVDIGQGDVRWVVLADPEGNELCVLTPR
jgi:predicted enzyme related to lactoylglutathione lyase